MRKEIIEGILARLEQQAAMCCGTCANKVDLLRDIRRLRLEVLGERQLDMFGGPDEPRT